MKKIKKYVFIILVLVVGIIICFYGFTYAKYVSDSIWNYYLGSKGFYFSSDYLGSNVVKNVNNLWDGGSVHFNIKNNLNQTVMTSNDIGYKVTCTIEGDASSYEECHMNGTSSNTQEGVLPSFQTCSNTTNDGIDVSLFNKEVCESKGYNWISQVSVKDLYFDVVLTDNNHELSDVTVNVTATSTSPYRKTLSGEFKLHKGDIKDSDITMNYKNYSNYDRLVISNSYSSSKCVKVTWNADKFMINADNSEFSSYSTDSNDYINEIKFKIGAKDSASYIFYRKDLSIPYDITEFSLEETSGC